MNPLQLRPFPRAAGQGDGSVQEELPQGFVDDAAILALMVGPNGKRPGTDQDDLVLAADLDFAGWCLSTALPPAEMEPSRRAEVRSHEPRRNLPVRRPAPPTFSGDPGIGEPHRGRHRWWLAGLTGLFSTLLFALLLFTLSARIHPNEDAANFIKAPAKDTSSTKQAAKPTPELTEATPID